MVPVAPVAQVTPLNATSGPGPTVLPPPRGPITGQLFESLGHQPSPISWEVTTAGADQDDMHLALYCCYELHYQGLAAVDPEWEWEPSLLALRRRLEHRFLADLRAMTRRPARPGLHGPATGPDSVVPQLWEMASHDAGPSLSRWVAEHATLEQVREFAIHRSAYQLKEADPHTWALPRLTGAPKAAMLAIQADEYGAGVAGDMHATLFSRTMSGLGLDPTESYLDLIPGVTLATTNLMSLFGLHRRWRGALVGHLALFEMTSVGPMGRYAQALRRLGVTEEGCRFYDVHVEADELHQHIATDEMVGGLLRQEPDLADDVIFGATALAAVEARFSRHLLGCWQGGEPSLRTSEAVGRVA